MSTRKTTPKAPASPAKRPSRSTSRRTTDTGTALSGVAATSQVPRDAVRRVLPASPAQATPARPTPEQVERMRGACSQDSFAAWLAQQPER